MSEYGAVERNHTDYGKGTGEGLKVFESTWGHRLLLGISVCMFVGGLILAIYCGMRLASLASADLSTNIGVLVAYWLYVIGLIGGVAVIPPAILGVYAATHPKKIMAAVVAGVIGLVIVAGICIYFIVYGGSLFSIILYTLALAIAPLLYLLSALKVKKAS